FGHHEGSPSDFRAVAAAHELRAPLLGIRAAIETALEEPSPMDAEGILRAACAELSRMAEVVDALLRFNGATWSRRGVELDTVARAAIRACELTSGTARVRLSISKNVRPTQGDHRQLVTAVSNLVRNAVEHARPGSEVVVRVESPGDHARI